MGSSVRRTNREKESKTVTISVSVASQTDSRDKPRLKEVIDEKPAYEPKNGRN